MESFNYKDQLADARWQKKKYEIFERDNYKCQKCGATKKLNVHHLSYEQGKLAWEYPNEKLITLCQECHENEHNIVPYPKVGKFYTYEHSDYWNDMLCYHIDYKKELIYLFGIDCGSYQGAWIECFCFDMFFKKCHNSTLLERLNSKEDNYDKSSFLGALENLKRGNVFIEFNTKEYTEESILSFAKNKIPSLLQQTMK